MKRLLNQFFVHIYLMNTMNKPKYVVYYYDDSKNIIMYDLDTKELKYEIEVNMFVKSIISFTNKIITYLSTDNILYEYDYNENKCINNIQITSNVFRIQLNPNENGYFNTNCEINKNELISVNMTDRGNIYKNIFDRSKITRFEYKFIPNLIFKKSNLDTRDYQCIIKLNNNIVIFKNNKIIWRDDDNRNIYVNVMILDTIKSLDKFYEELDELIDQKININMTKIIGSYIE